MMVTMVSDELNGPDWFAIFDQIDVRVCCVGPDHVLLIAFSTNYIVIRYYHFSPSA